MSVTSSPSSKVQIRKASLNDISHVQAIAYATWPVAYGKLLREDELNYMLEEIYSTSSLAQQIHNNHQFLLAVVDDNPIGFGSFSNENGTTYKLQKLYVLPTVQKSGVGKMILQTIISTVKSLGGEVLTLNVKRDNVARLFYERHGFVVVEEVDIDIGNGYWMRDYLMRLEVNAYYGY